MIFGSCHLILGLPWQDTPDGFLEPGSSPDLWQQPSCLWDGGTLQLPEEFDYEIIEIWCQMATWIISCLANTLPGPGFSCSLTRRLMVRGSPPLCSRRSFLSFAVPRYFSLGAFFRSGLKAGRACNHHVRDILLWRKQNLPPCLK